MKPTRRRLVIIITVLVAVTLVGVYTVPRIVIHIALSAICDDPRFRLQPVALDLAQVAAGPGPELTWYGHAFEVPWEGGEETIEEGVSRVEFASGARVAMFDPEETVDFRDVMLEAADGEEEKLEAVMGEVTLRTNYDMMRACLEFDLGELDFFDSWEDHVRASILSALKGMFAVGGDTGIFSFTTGSVRGFQMGDPAKAGHVILYLFDESDTHVELVVHGAATQAEVNRIITTFRGAD